MKRLLSRALAVAAVVGFAIPKCTSGGEGQWGLTVVEALRGNSGQPYWVGFMNQSEQAQGICAPPVGSYDISNENGDGRSGNVWPEASSPHYCVGEKQRYLVLPGETLFRLGVLPNASDSPISMSFTLHAFDGDLGRRVIGQVEWKGVHAQSAESFGLREVPEQGHGPSVPEDNWRASAIPMAQGPGSRTYWVGLRNASDRPRAIRTPTVVIDTPDERRRLRPEERDEGADCSDGADTILVLSGQTSYSLAGLRRKSQGESRIRIKVAEVDASRPCTRSVRRFELAVALP